MMRVCVYIDMPVVVWDVPKRERDECLPSGRECRLYFVSVSEALYVNVSLKQHVFSAIRQTAVSEGFVNVSQHKPVWRRMIAYSRLFAFACGQTCFRLVFLCHDANILSNTLLYYYTAESLCRVINLKPRWFKDSCTFGSTSSIIQLVLNIVKTFSKLPGHYITEVLILNACVNMFLMGNTYSDHFPLSQRLIIVLTFQPVLRVKWIIVQLHRSPPVAHTHTHTVVACLVYNPQSGLLNHLIIHTLHDWLLQNDLVSDM